MQLMQYSWFFLLHHLNQGIINSQRKLGAAFCMAIFLAAFPFSFMLFRRVYFGYGSLAAINLGNKGSPLIWFHCVREQVGSWLRVKTNQCLDLLAKESQTRIYFVCLVYTPLLRLPLCSLRLIHSYCYLLVSSPVFLY